MSIPTHTNSYYAASANDTVLRPELSGEHSCDVCIVGAGFTGISSALHLAEAGFKVIVVEASRIGFGASGRNGGQLVNSYSRDIDFIKRHYGEQVGEQMAAMAFEGQAVIRQQVAKYQISCDLKQGGIFAACNAKQFEELKAKKALWEAHGNDQLELLNADEIKNYIGTERYVGGLLDRLSGHVHPLNLVLGEAAAFESLGGVIYEASPVTKVQEANIEGELATVTTAKGSVKAKQVIVAGNAYITGIIPEVEKNSMPCGTQIIATEPLSEEMQKAIMPQDVCVEDCNYLLDYFRLSGDGRLLYGGGTTYGAREPEKVEALIVPKMLKTFPMLKDVKIDHAWTGNFLLTLMRLPQVGRIGSNVYYSQGYSGHGVTSTHLLGKVLAEAIQGDTKRFDVFAGLPQYPFPGGRALRVPYTAVGAAYYALRDKLGI